MKNHTVVVLFVSVGAVLASCAEKNSDCANARDCPNTFDAGVDARPPLRDCNLEDICPNEGTGVFVASGGDDANDGTRARPFKTLGRALKDTGSTDGGPSERRVFVCEGHYAEELHIEGDVAIHGGFTCFDWKFSGTPPIVVAKHPLRIHDVKNVSLSDLNFGAFSPSGSGASSIAGFISDSTVSLRRVLLTAGEGSDGEYKYVADSFSPSEAPGNPGRDKFSNPICGEAETRAGGSAGLCGFKAGHVGQDQNRTEFVPAGADGKGGAEGVECGSSANGTRGSDGSGGAAGVPATRFGTLTATGWTPAGGTSGGTGGTGQGGGGSTGPADTGSNCVGGSGGGPPGCGGAGGAGTNGGGSSIALAIYNSRVTVAQSQLRAAYGGRGGKGGDGGWGQAGGAAFPSTTCLDGTRIGGRGGAGGGGGGGAGGAGGLSVGILWTGTAPSLDGQSVASAATLGGITVAKPGAGGAPGDGGKPGVGGDPRASGRTPAAGIAGIAQAVLGLAVDGSIVVGDSL